MAIAYGWSLVRAFSITSVLPQIAGIPIGRLFDNIADTESTKHFDSLWLPLRGNLFTVLVK
jgi:hypothetical protein